MKIFLIVILSLISSLWSLQFSLQNDNIGFEVRTTIADSNIQLYESPKVNQWKAKSLASVTFTQQDSTLSPSFKRNAILFSKSQFLVTDKSLALTPSSGTTRFAILIAFKSGGVKTTETLFDGGNGIKVTLSPSSNTDNLIASINFHLPNQETHSVQTCVGNLSVYAFSVSSTQKETATGNISIFTSNIYKDGKSIGSTNVPINDVTEAALSSTWTIGCAQGGTVCVNNVSMAILYIIRENLDETGAKEYYDIFKGNQLAVSLGLELCGNGETEGREECDGDANCTCACQSLCSPLPVSELSAINHWSFPDGAEDRFPSASIRITCDEKTAPIYGFEKEVYATCVQGTFVLPILKCAQQCGDLQSHLDKYYANQGLVLLTGEVTDAISNSATADVTAAVSVKTSAAAGALMKVGCAKGYSSLDGRESESIVCQSGTWSKVTLQCMKECDAFRGASGEYKVSSTQASPHGSSILIQCSSGFSSYVSKESSEYLYCINGDWTKPTLLCEKNCEAFPALSYGYKFVDSTISAPSNSAGTVVQIRCDTASHYSAAQRDAAGDETDVIICANGEWSQQSLVCQSSCEPYYLLETDHMEYNLIPSKDTDEPTSPVTSSTDRSTLARVAYGRQILLSCEAGYYSSTQAREETILCQGSWSQRSLNCQSTCSSSPSTQGMANVQLATYDPKDVFQGSTRVIQCQPGTSSPTFMEQDTLVCVNGSWSQSSLTCLPNCSSTPFEGRVLDEKIYNMDFSLSEAEPTTHTYPLDSKVRLSCKDGYASPEGSINEDAICTTNGWTTTSLECRPTCPAFSDLGLGYSVQGEETNYHGSVRRVSCLTGYSNAASNGVTEDVSVCSNGMWSPISLECRMDCKDSQMESFLMITEGRSNKKHGSTRTIACANSGKSLDGTKENAVEEKSVATCIDGSWKYTPLQCQGDCPAIDLHDGMYTIVESESNLGDNGDYCSAVGCAFEITCNSEKYMETTPSKITCTDLGTWDGVYPVCSGKCSAFPSLGEKYKVDVIDSFSVQVSCAPKYSSQFSQPLSVYCVPGDSENNWHFTPDQYPCNAQCEAFTVPSGLELATGANAETKASLLQVDGDTVVSSAAGEAAIPPSASSLKSLIVGADSAHGTQLSLRCKNDSENGDSITCINGKWTSPAVQCVNTCSPPPGNILFSDYLSGTTMKDGYTLLEGTLAFFTQPSDNGSKVRISCKDGYVNVQGSFEEDIVCSNGEYSIPSLICEKPCSTDVTLPCDDPSSVCPYISLGTSTAPGSTRTVNCSAGYQSINPDEKEQKISCQNGVWTSPSLVCVKECPAPIVNVQDGLELIATEKSGTTATVKCLNGWSSAALGVREQQINCHEGAWTSPTLHCAENCSPIAPFSKDWGIQILQEETSSSSITNEQNTRLTVGCLEGYKSVSGVEEKEYIYCRNSSWSSPSLRCVPSCSVDVLQQRLAKQSSSFPGASLLTTKVESPVEVVLNCPENSLPIRGMDGERIMCNNGDWSSIELLCSPQCAPYVPSTSLVATDYQVLEGGDKPVSHGESARVTCAIGFEPVSGDGVEAEETILCLFGQWSAQTLQCAKPCGKLELKNVQISGEATGDNRHGTSRYASCIFGTRTITGPIADSITGVRQRVTCIDGEWVGPTIDCKKSCSASQQHLSTFEEECKNGESSLTGDITRDSRICIDGTVQPSTLQCATNCPSFDVSVHAPGLVLNSTATLANTQGTVATVSCPQGSQPLPGLNTTEDLVCWKSNWSVPTLQCAKECTSPPVADPQAIVTVNGLTASISCRSGFIKQQPMNNNSTSTIINRTVTSTCVDGQWTLIDIQCSRVVEGTNALSLSEVWSPWNYISYVDAAVSVLQIKGTTVLSEKDAEFMIFRANPVTRRNADGTFKQYFPIGDLFTLAGSTKDVSLSNIILVSGMVVRPAGYEFVWGSTDKTSYSLTNTDAIRSLLQKNTAATQDGQDTSNQGDDMTKLQNGASAIKTYMGENPYRLTIWKPISPPDYTCVGYVASNSNHAPSRDAIRCIHTSCVKSTSASPVPTASSVRIWTVGDSASTAGTFIAQSSQSSLQDLTKIMTLSDTCINVKDTPDK